MHAGAFLFRLKEKPMTTNNLEPRIKLIISRPDNGSDSALGPGVVALCQGVAETGSLNAAAKEMGMAYSKAWKTIKETEEALGIQLLIRNGAQGSSLSNEGAKLIEAYEELQIFLQMEAQRMFSNLME